ncbi:MAG: NAD(P)/FAD-dependent oxidoreductase [Candidatus Aenigmarchaeota archaeon]|nr:NAD(P)/FAD-dependent oxidoreductase [Candidatus Aenigmarchaeota archaeon]
MADVAIVGAGPVGLYLASLLQKDLDVLVLDASRTLGRKADSGLYSTHLEEHVPLRKEWVQHKVRAAVLSSPHARVRVEKPATAAYVVNRERFQQWLAGRLDAPPRLAERVERLQVDSKVTLHTSKGKHEASLLIGADGASSVVRKHWGILPQERLNGLIALTQEPCQDDHVDLLFDKSKIPDGFFWRIPRGETTEYGALGKNVQFPLLARFFGLRAFEQHAAFMNAGLIPTAFPRTLLVGEAACQVKPWSFGGIIFGFTAARLAAQTIRQAFRRQDFSQPFLQQYDDAWKQAFGGTISLGLSLREVFRAMTNPGLDALFRKLGKMDLRQADMDFPSLEVFG